MTFSFPGRFVAMPTWVLFFNIVWSFAKIPSQWVCSKKKKSSNHIGNTTMHHGALAWKMAIFCLASLYNILRKLLRFETDFGFRERFWKMPGCFVKCDGNTNIFFALDFVCGVIAETIPRTLGKHSSFFIWVRNYENTHSINNQPFYYLIAHGFKQL